MHYYPFVSHLDPIVVENSLVVLCLVDRTPVEVEWQFPLTILGLLLPCFMIGMFENMIS
jgi:hypothetical protein